MCLNLECGWSLACMHMPLVVMLVRDIYIADKTRMIAAGD